MLYSLNITCDTAEELAEVASALEILAAQRVQNAANKAVVVEILQGSELDEQIRQAETEALSGFFGEQRAEVQRLAEAEGIDGSFRFANEEKLLRDPFAEPKKLEPGMYRTKRTTSGLAAGSIVRVYQAAAGTHLLAKGLIEGTHGWRFDYLGAASRFVQPDERMTLEEAKAFGADYGTCCVCARLLTDPESVAAGIGPVCAGRV